MTSPSPLSLGAPFSLGDPSVLHTARMDRLALGVNFLPSATALGAVSGIVHGPPGSVGELTLVSDTVLRVDPFVAVLQGTHNTRQGQYVVPNEQQRDLAVAAKDASLFRRSLLVIRVADSLEAGVAASATTNGAWLERIDGGLAASNPALPPLPANAVALGELSIPSAASGQPVQLTPYNPRTGARHGILPVFDDTSTVPGHGSAPGSFVGQYRDHPTRGAERWNGATWKTASPVDAPVGSWRRTGSAPGSLASDAFVALTWNLEEEDTHGMWTSGYEVRCKRDGLYWLSAGFSIATHLGRRVMQVRKNPTGTNQDTGTLLAGATAAGGNPDAGVNVAQVVRLSENDRVVFWAYQDSGATVNTLDLVWARTFLSLAWLRPLP